jgi:hypothetical protein
MSDEMQVDATAVVDQEDGMMPLLHYPTLSGVPDNIKKYIDSTSGP